MTPPNPKLLVSDANVLIDLEEGLVIESFFMLPCSFCTPDILFHQELRAQHPQLLDLGLQLFEIDPKHMLYAADLNSHHRGPSFNDLLALSLAKRELCPLLSGDKALRKVAEEENVEVKGTLWAIESMVQGGLISYEEANLAYDRMESSGSRLPWSIARRRLKALCQS